MSYFLILYIYFLQQATKLKFFKKINKKQHQLIVQFIRQAR